MCCVVEVSEDVLVLTRESKDSSVTHENRIAQGCTQLTVEWIGGNTGCRKVPGSTKLLHDVEVVGQGDSLSLSDWEDFVFDIAVECGPANCLPWALRS